jgi:hypothetical protein
MKPGDESHSRLRMQQIGNFAKFAAIRHSTTFSTCIGLGLLGWRRKRKAWAVA